MSWRPDLDWITDDLAVGGHFPAGRAADLARLHRVNAVIDVRVEAGDDAQELAACGLRFLHLPTEDLCGVSQEMLDEGVAFAREMRRHGRRLLVHCQHGVGRSATVALCILADRGLSPRDALILAKDARAKISPSEAQYRAWIGWLRRRTPDAAILSYHTFGCVAYRHLATET
jgi:protein-tyrosine phosphatase